MGYSSNDVGGQAAAAEAAQKEANQKNLHPQSVRVLPIDANIPAGKLAQPHEW